MTSKYKESDVKPFSFSEITGAHVVTQTKFEEFSFKEISGQPFKKETLSEDHIRKERGHEKSNAGFKIEGVVRESRGIDRQEKSDMETAIQAEVTRRLEQAYKDAYAEGLEKGRKEGQEESSKEYHEILGQKIEELGHALTQVMAQSDDLIEKNRAEVYEFIKRFTKWIIMKEIDEKVYLQGLLEKLILELNARKNLIIKVGRANFAQMPEVVAAVEQRLGQLQNTRVEIVPEIQYPGIILEAENGLIDGSLEGVFKNIDKIFEQVIVGE
jgi:flagellar assembly protein FliH